jgi:hypothetical protein
LNSFSLFVVIPKKGVHRMQVHDVSELGMGFDVDIEGETPEEFPLREGEVLDLRFYLNQSLYIPLGLSVVRVERKGSVRRVGATFDDKNSKGYKALASFLHMLDGILDSVKFDPEGQG